jgi:hypothetical protein
VLTRVRILGDISITHCLIISPLQVIMYFGFSKYITLPIYLDSTSMCIAKPMYLENSKHLIIWNGVRPINKELLILNCLFFYLFIFKHSRHNRYLVVYI